MFSPENVPSLVRAVANTGRILILSVPSQDVVSKVKNAMLEMRHEHTFVGPTVGALFDDPSMLDKEQIIIVADATQALKGDSEDFIKFMSLAQRRDYKAAVVAIAILDGYDSHAAQYCMNVRVS